MRISKMKKEFLVGVSGLLAVVAVAAYFYWNTRSEDSGQAGRKLASADLATVAFSIPEDADFNTNVKLRLIQSATTELIGDSVHLHFGAFEVVGSTEKHDVCELYPQIEIILRAEGIAIEGDVPEFTAKRPCEHAAASETLAPVIVPAGDLSVTAPEWYVFGVRLSDPKSGQMVDVDGYEINFIRGSPLMIQLSN